MLKTVILNYSTRRSIVLSLPLRANVIKLLSSMIYGFSYEARVFVRLGRKSLPGTKHSSTLQKFVNYGRKTFYNIGT